MVAADPQAVENLIFKDTFFWFPLSLVVGLVILTVGVSVHRARR